MVIIMKGEIIKTNAGSKDNPDTKGDLNPHSYFIRGDDGLEYFAHMGDIKSTEEKIIDMSKNGELEKFDNTQRVEFTVFDSTKQQNKKGRAINVKKIS